MGFRRSLVRIQSPRHAKGTFVRNDECPLLFFPSRRYLDTFVKMDGAWLFAERRLYVDWLEERALS
jgi:hypothetical protein